MLDKQLASAFRLCRIARSSTAMFADLLLVCLVNTTCAIANIMANLVFTIVSLSHAFFLVVPVGSPPSTHLQGLRQFFDSNMHNIPKHLAHSFVLMFNLTMMSRSSASNSYVAKHPLLTITCCRRSTPAPRRDINSGLN